MKDDELKSVFQRAAEISKAVPEPLREAAFNRAVDALLNKVAKPASNTVTQGSKSKAQKQTENGEERNVDYILEHLDRTAYPEVSSAPRVLDRALHLLRIAHDKFDIDGLGSTDIAKILTEKFRLRATKQAVQQSLDAARNYVDRVARKGRTIYRIMQAGERYLDSDEQQSLARGVTQSSHKKGQVRNSQTKVGSQNNPKSKAIKKKSTGGRPGPRVALNQLVEEGYFASPRRIAGIQEHLNHAKAHSYKTGDLSSTLTRMLRDGVLVRNRAEDGQYEYKRK